MNLYKAILAQYGKAVTGGVGSFSQMGFTEAELIVKALVTQSQGAYTVASVNAAIKGLKDVNTGMLCQQWTYGSYSSPPAEQHGLHDHGGQRADGARAERRRLHADLREQLAGRRIPCGGRDGAPGPDVDVTGR